MAAALVELSLSLCQLAFLGEDHAGIVVTANAVILAGGSLVCFQLGGVVVGQRSGIQHLLLAQNVDILGSGLLDFGVGATFDIHVGDQLRTAQLRQNLLSQHFEHSRHALDLLVALYRVVLHSQHLKNQILVFDVRCGNQFLEAFPVLTVSGDVVFRVNARELLGDRFLTALATLLRELVVELHRTVGRCITLGIYVAQRCAILVGILFHEVLEHLDLLFGQLARTHVGTVDLIHDIRILG